MNDNSSDVAAKAVLRIAAKWVIKNHDLAILLGGVSVTTIQRWRHQVRKNQPLRSKLNRDQLDRSSYILGTYKAPHDLFSDETQADSRIHRPVAMPGFDGQAAIEVMRNGSMADLQHVRRFLDGWHANDTDRPGQHA